MVGDPLDEHTDVGPLINQAAADRVLDLIQDAVAKGGRVIVGGSGTASGGTVRPTVIAELPPKSRLASEEAFGPVVGVAAIEDVNEGVELANASPFGLQAGIFTGRVDRAIVLARRLQFGAVLINETPTFRADQMPYGGVKQSGNTREGPHSAVHAMSIEKLVVIQLPEDRSS
jgi:acyl-CoA reductase-like NAD-dependent aldehyde dehydrogenase